MSSVFGITPAGFVSMRQQDIIAQMQASLQASFGSNINLDDASVFGQLVGIMSEREALLWALAQAIYANGTVQGATGTGVDNLLALSGLRRLTASATVTNPDPVVENGTTLYGLVLYGTAGLTIPAGTLLSNGAAPAVTFATDADIYIAPGSPAQGTGTATCTTTGPNYVAAGTLTTIVNSLTGFTGCTNQLDCITGSNAESDSAALLRLSNARASQGSTSTAAVGQRVGLVSGVTTAVAYSNMTNSAQQVVSFDATPSSGSYQIALSDYTTGILIYNASAAQLAAAINVLPGYAAAQVTGSLTYGFVIDFNGSAGGQAEPLLQVVNNSTGVNITARYGRPPHSIEVIADGGTNADVAAAILASAPAGIGLYGSAVLMTLASPTQGSTVLPVNSTAGLSVGLGVTTFGVIPGTKIVAIGNGSVTMSAPAIGSYTSQTCKFDYTTQVVDSAGNPQLVSFSRPTQIPIYVGITLATDKYNIPGNALSGLNSAALWSDSYLTTIKNDILAIGNAIGIGGLVTGRGTNGLANCFTSVPGLIDSNLYFDVATPAEQNAPVRLLANQAPLFEVGNIEVSTS